MQEAVYPTLAASYDYYYRTGEVPPRTGNRQSGLNSAPYNVFPTKDGHVAIHIVTEAHFQNLLKAMGREELRRRSALRHQRRPRRAHGRDRRARRRMDPARSARWRCSPAPRQYRIPCAPVRNAPEVMNDPHMHERGMLERIDHPELGRDRRADDAVAPARHRQGRDAGRARPSASTTMRSTAAGSGFAAARSPS